MLACQCGSAGTNSCHPVHLIKEIAALGPEWLEYVCMQEDATQLLEKSNLAQRYSCGSVDALANPSLGQLLAITLPILARAPAPHRLVPTRDWRSRLVLTQRLFEQDLGKREAFDEEKRMWSPRFSSPPGFWAAAGLSTP